MWVELSNGRLRYLTGDDIEEFYRQHTHESSDWIIKTKWGETVTLSPDENPSGINEEIERVKKWKL